VVHILAKGQIVKTGGPELADELEADGYAAYLPADAVEAPNPAVADPLADPFADPLA
jgi:hypothetical protein